MTGPLSNLAQQIRVPPIRKTVLQHCGYTCLQGVPAPWTCPGCGTVIQPPA